MKLIVLFLLLNSPLALAHINHIPTAGTPGFEEEAPSEAPPKTSTTPVSSEPTVETPVSREIGDSKEPPISGNTTVNDDVITTVIIPFEAHSAASDKNARKQDLLARPATRPADILQIIPGFYSVQHAGGGKANQYFLRGFDLDHGTDIDLRIDGIPMNMVSHGHGQGYADANFIIPETVSAIQVHKGPYRADQGDFSVAGSVKLKTVESYKQNTITYSHGDFETSRIFFGLSPKIEGYKTVLAGELFKTDGPFKNEENLKRYNVLGKVTRNVTSSSKLTLGASLYSSDWSASNQIPLRKVKDGSLDRFGFVDPTDGGSTQRNHYFFNYLMVQENDSFDLNFYNIDYNYALNSNFTFFSVDPVNGDQIQQTDQRKVYGAQLRWRRNLGGSSRSNILTIGSDWRRDNIDNALYKTKSRERLSQVVGHNVVQTNMAFFVENEKKWNDWFSSVLGLRSDYFLFQVNDETDPLSPGVSTSDSKGVSLLQPKANLIAGITKSVNLFLNYGKGFHSNDARGIVSSSNKVTPVTEADTYEVGMRQFLLERKFSYSLAAYLINMKSETVWVGDEASSEFRPKSERRGVELEMRYQPTSWMIFDLDLNYAHSYFRGVRQSENAVPLAPSFISTAGATLMDYSGYYGRLGMFHIADRYGSEDRFIKAHGFTRFDLTVGKRIDQWDFSVTAQNLLDAKIREAQFVNTSRTQGETAAGCTGGSRVDNSAGFVGCEDIHFTPAYPLFLMARATYSFD